MKTTLWQLPAWVTVVVVSGAVLLTDPAAPLPVRLAFVVGLAAGAALAGLTLGEAAGRSRAWLEMRRQNTNRRQL